MNNPRLNELLKFLAEDPNDPFTLYAIALEYTKVDEQKACEYFNLLLSNHSDYIPTYYHAGKLFEKMGHKIKAENVYRKGMDLSQKKGNRHAFSELQGALNLLLDEEDE